MEREIHSILGPLGVKEPLSRLVAEDLRSVEDEIYGSSGAEGSEGVMPGANVVSESGKKKSGLLNWRTKKAEEEDGGVRGNEEMGMTAFLLKFGEGMGKLMFHFRSQNCC